ncbi:MAG: heavy metal translocating P-type ATPase [Spirochaetota bacterium]
MTDTKLRVFGMHCANCALTIEHALKGTEGITNAAVNFAGEDLFLTYDSQRITLGRIVDMIRKIGYRAEPTDASERIAVAERAEENDLMRRLTVGIAFTAPVLILSMVGDLLDTYLKIGFIAMIPYRNVIVFLLTTPVQWYAGWPFIKRAWSEVKRLETGMDTLVSIGTLTAYVYSTVLLALWIFGFGEPSMLHYESSAAVITLVMLGKYIERRSTRRARSSLAKLFSLVSKTAMVEVKRSLIETPVERIVPGDIIVARTGERIAVDGVILQGITAIDESALSGESIPVMKKKGSEVFAATVNTGGMIKYRAVRVGEATVFGAIVRAVNRAVAKKPKIQFLTDRIATFFVPTMLFVAVVTLIVWLALGHIGEAFMHAVAVLVIACPCALGLATPTAVMVASGMASERGMLIADADSLDRARLIRTVIFDKTGTLTEGKMNVTHVHVHRGRTPPALSIVYALERYSNHPLAGAIREYCEKQKVKQRTVVDFQEILGRGVEGRIAGKRYFAGNVAFIRQTIKRLARDITIEAAARAEAGETVILLSDARSVIAVIGIADTLRPESASTVAALKKRGIRTVLISGDVERAAQAAGKAAGIDDIIAGVLPNEKAKKVSEYKARGVTAFVGDGINDAIALSTADVGIGLASGSDIARSTAQVTFMGGGVSRVTDLIDLSRAASFTIRSNLAWAFVYNCIGIPLAAFGMLHPMFAGIAMALSSISVVTNSLLLKRRVRTTPDPMPLR